MLILPFALAWHVTGTLGGTLLWGLLVALTASVLPMAVIVRGARLGRWKGHHVTNREGRVVPLLVAAASLISGTVVMLVGGAPRPLLALMGSMVAALVVSSVVTFGLRWKISLHSAVAFASTATMAVVSGLWPLVFLVPAVLVAWSRVELGDHTTAQVLAGALMGVVVGGGTFWVLLD
ncbi:hypothetical protein [Umezawaea beigongshangensis]|uniref:hypothetical protein n=1 Tax=Umezawaea beigongshangensis TaxID=2780383 RepID=UPI0027DCDA08|nr:hypothetical protein [Umezawaea beigongshangensis]